MSNTTVSIPHVELHGDRQAQCTCCGALFNTDNLFDRHRTGSYAKPGKLRMESQCSRLLGWQGTQSNSACPA